MSRLFRKPTQFIITTCQAVEDLEAKDWVLILILALTVQIFLFPTIFGLLLSRVEDAAYGARIAACDTEDRVGELKITISNLQRDLDEYIIRAHEDLDAQEREKDGPRTTRTNPRRPEN